MCFHKGNTKRNLAYFRRKFPYVNVRRCNQTDFYSKLKKCGDIDAKKYDLEAPRTGLARCDIRTLWTPVLEPKAAPSQATCRLGHVMYIT